jgi:hypothetical protein
MKLDATQAAAAKLSHLIEPGRTVYSTDGHAYRVLSKIAAGGSLSFRLANLQGQPVPIPADFSPIDGARMRFASFLKFAFNKDLTAIVNSLIEQAGLPTDPAMNWAGWFQKVYGEILASVTPNFDLQDEIMYNTVIKLLMMRKDKDGKTLLENAADKISGLSSGINKIKRQLRDPNLTPDEKKTLENRLHWQEKVKADPVEKQVSSLLKKTFEYYARHHARVDAKNYAYSVHTPSHRLETENIEDVAIEQPTPSGEGTYNILDTEEHGVAPGVGLGESERDIMQFIDQFQEWVRGKETPKSAPNYAELLRIYWDQAQRIDDVKISDLTQEWIRRTGLSFDSLKQYRDKLGILIRDFVYENKVQLGNSYKFVDLLKHMFPPPKQKARPAKASSDHHHDRTECRKCGNVQTCRCPATKVTSYVASCDNCKTADGLEARVLDPNCPEYKKYADDLIRRFGQTSQVSEMLGQFEDEHFPTCVHCQQYNQDWRAGKVSAAKPKCPHCGSDDYGLMPTDFETAKCNGCGKNWNHGIVKGINDPKEAARTADDEGGGKTCENCGSYYGGYTCLNCGRKKKLEEEVDRTSKELKKFPKGPTGMTPDDVKATPEWQAAKRNYGQAFAKLREFNSKKCAADDPTRDTLDETLKYDNPDKDTKGFHDPADLGQCACEWDECPLGHQAGGCQNPAAHMLEIYGYKTRYCQPCTDATIEYIRLEQGTGDPDDTVKILSSAHTAGAPYCDGCDRLKANCICEGCECPENKNAGKWGDKIKKMEARRGEFIEKTLKNAVGPTEEDDLEMARRGPIQYEELPEMETRIRPREEQSKFPTPRPTTRRKEGMLGHDFVDADQQAIRPDITPGDTGRLPHGRTQGSVKESAELAGRGGDKDDVRGAGDLWREEFYQSGNAPPKIATSGKWKVLLRDSKGNQREQEVSGVNYGSAERAVRKYMKNGERVVSMTIASKTAAPAPAAPAQAQAPAPAPAPAATPAPPAQAPSANTVVAPPPGTPIALPSGQGEDTPEKRTVPPEIPNRKYHMTSKNSALKTEQNTPEMEAQVAQLAQTNPLTEIHENCNPYFEHGQWWVVCGPCGATWSVVDVGQFIGDEGDIDLEEIDNGDGSCAENFHESADHSSPRQGFIYQAEMWCPTCAKEIAADIQKNYPKQVPADPTDEYSYDSDSYPKGPFFEEESDAPEHCAGCHIFLENPLTTHGQEYMQSMVDEALAKGRGEEPHIKEWMDFYGYHPDTEGAEDEHEASAASDRINAMPQRGKPKTPEELGLVEKSDTELRLEGIPPRPKKTADGASLLEPEVSFEDKPDPLLDNSNNLQNYSYAPQKDTTDSRDTATLDDNIEILKRYGYALFSGGKSGGKQFWKSPIGTVVIMSTSGEWMFGADGTRGTTSTDLDSKLLKYHHKMVPKAGASKTAEIDMGQLESVQDRKDRLSKPDKSPMYGVTLLRELSAPGIPKGEVIVFGYYYPDGQWGKQQLQWWTTMAKTEYDSTVTQVKRRSRGTNQEKSTALYESLKGRGTAVEPGTSSDAIIEQFKTQKESSMENKQAAIAQPTSGEDEGYYVKVTYTKGGIDLSPTENLLREVAEEQMQDESGNSTYEFAHNIELDDIWEMMEDFFTNGWEKVNPEDIGALTDGEIFSDPNGNVYWHERYQIESMTDELKAGNTVFMQYGGNLFDEEDEETPAPDPNQMNLPLQSSKKEATGEMSQSEADDREAWPMHHAIADALGGTVKAFDQYQGPYVLVGSEARGQGTYAPAIPMKGTVRLWVQADEGSDGAFLTVYNEDNDKVSEPFHWEDMEGAVNAAMSVMGDEPETIEASTKQAELDIPKPDSWGCTCSDKGARGQHKSNCPKAPKQRGEYHGASKQAAPGDGGLQRDVQNQYENHPLIEMLWGSLKRDPANKDRVQTAWGTKTKQGLVLSVARAMKESPVSGKESSQKCKCGKPTAKGDHRCEDCRSKQHSEAEKATGVE